MSEGKIQKYFTAADLITLTTSDDSVRFNGAVTLDTDVAIDTGAGVGDILFTRQATVDSAGSEANDLTLTAGTGTVSFNANIGGGAGGVGGRLVVTDASGHRTESPERTIQINTKIHEISVPVQVGSR